MAHVGWPQLLTVAIWQRTSASILESGQTLDAFRDDAAAGSLWDEYLKQLGSQLAIFDRDRRGEEEAENEGPALDAYFTRVGGSLGDQAAAQGAKSAQALTLLGLLRSVTGERPCATCSGAGSGETSAPTCKWTKSSESEDSKILASRGHCIRSVRELFELAQSVAVAAYRDALGRELEQTLELETSHGSRDLQLDSAVGGLTTEVVPTKSRQVLVTFDVGSLAMADYLAVYYIFVHECLVHGYCGINVSASAAVTSRSFHDGWMDCVAAYYVRSPPTPAAGVVYPSASRFLQMFGKEMDRVRSIRFDTSRGSAAADARKWTRGVDAFHTALELFGAALERLGRPTGAALTHLLSFSLQVNASSLSHEKRGDLVSVLNRVFWRNNDYDRGLALMKNCQVVDFFGDFILYGGADNLLDRVVTTQWTV